MSNDFTTKKVTEKTPNEDSSILSNSTNTSFSENIIQDVNNYKTKDIYLITKNLENKISEILNYLQNDSNTISNKLLIIKYLENLFTKACFNSEIFSYKYSNDKDKLNIFQIIINQYIICPNDKDDYLRELKNLFTVLLSQINIDKDTYHYIFSFLINYINNNVNINENIIQFQDNNMINYNGEHLSKILQLLQIYYQSIQTIEEPYNYFYFVNGESDSSINILDIDSNKLLNENESLNILVFIKLLPSQIIKQVYPRINYKIIDVFFTKNKKISIGIDVDNCLITNFTSKQLKNLPDNKTISILAKFSFNDTIKTEIFVNNEKVEIPKDSIIKEKDKKNSKEKLEIKKIKLFETFIGICSNIILYKESEKEREGLPKFFIFRGLKGDAKDKNILKQIYLNGLYNEELFSVLIRQQLKEEIEDKNLRQLTFPIQDKSGENDIKEFLEKNLISIYMPNRIMLSEDQINKTYKNANRIILKDSINNIDAEFITNSPYINGIHLFTKISEDFSHFGGLNHFLPIIEIMSQNENLLIEGNLVNFFNLIISVFVPSYLNYLKKENDSNFFFNLSLFLSKIHEIYFDDQIANKLISISSFLIYLDKNYINLIQQFHNHILMNKNILFKFHYEDQALILQQVKSFINCSQITGFDIDIMPIINILINYDKEKNNIFCCKFHSEYFNEACEALSPELHILLKPIEEIIAKLFEKFIKEASRIKENDIKECEIGLQLFKLFEILTLDISPCLQKMLINQFINYMKVHGGKYYALLDEENKMFDIILFIFKTSIFDVKIDALKLIFYMNEFLRCDNTRSKSQINPWAYKNENDLINEDKKIFIQNHILPFYLLGEGILISSSSKISYEGPTSTEGIENNNDCNIVKKTYSERKIIKISKSINDFRKLIDIHPNCNLNKVKTKSTEKNNNFKIKKNGKVFHYIKITANQQKIYLKYKRKKINDLIIDLYNNIYLSLNKKIDFDFILNLLVKIVSKGDIILILKFLDDINPLKIKEKKELIYNNIQFFQWLLDTSFQAYMIKNRKFDEGAFLPGFCMNPFKEESGVFNEEEKKQKVEKILQTTNEFIIDILKENIYKLDLIFTWSKYYYEMRNEKNNFKVVRDFVLDILRSSYKLPYEISFSDKTNEQPHKESLYYLNLLFEFLTFYKLNETKANLIEEEFSKQNSHRIYNLLLDIDVGNKRDDNDLMKTLNIKWTSFPYYQKIYSFFKPLWTGLLDKKGKGDIDMHTLKKYIEKKNMFINALEFLFYSITEIQTEDKDLSDLYANKGIKAIYMIFIFFILLFNVGGNNSDVHIIYNDFRLFITLLIVSSCTLKTSSDPKKQKWPNDMQYKEVQETVKLILCFTLNYLSNKIIDIDNISNKTTNKALIDYYSYVRKILIEELGYFLQLINIIYKENIGKKLSKILSSFDNTIKFSGPYMLSEKLYSCIETYDNGSNKSNNKNDNFLDNLLKIDINRKSKDNNSELEKNVKLFIESKKINEYLNSYLSDENNTKQLFSFEEYIQKREHLINTIIPIYDNRVNSYNSEKNLCLVPDYWQDCDYSKTIDVKIGRIYETKIKELLINQKKINLEENEKIIEYKKIKKKLFSFKGIWSKEEYFYENRYHLKYKLVNHLTEDYSRILLTPILDLDYYLPTFSLFKNENLFRYPEKQIPIYYLADLSFALSKSHKSFLNSNEKEAHLNKNTQENTNNGINTIKTEKDIINKKNDSNINIDEILKINDNIQNDIKKVNTTQDINNVRKSKKTSKKRLNALYDVKLANYSFHNNSMSLKLNDSIIFSKYIKKKHLSNSKTDKQVNACLIKIEFHICGIFYQNSKEIGFYSSERIHTDEEDYDPDRKVCFGSVFKPQINKYNNYYLKIPYNSIEFVLKRRYYFKKTVLEIFTINKKSYSFKFEEKELKEIYENIRNYMKSDIEDITIEYNKYEDKIGFYNRNRMLSKDIYLPNIIKNMNLKSLYEKWAKWEISTLKFLMILNLYANRSYNDINQYPVFPWIITDYSSDILETQNSIRPLETPMGMLEISEEAAERRKSFLSSWDACGNEKDPDEDFDRYRTHYSTSLYVTYYLVRVFPFSSIRIELQGKNFDDPNRLFNSLFDSFNCAVTQKADVRELVPEFFYLPEIFCNLNKLNLGNLKNKEKKTETPVNDVKMPKWANYDPYIFVNKHRMLLESTEVNEKMNEWFNIIFGYKQKGSVAKKIGNLFLKQTYENFEETYDKSDTKSKIYFCRLVEFGVTPHQIFKYEINKRMNYNELKTKRLLFPNITEIIKKNEEKNKNLEQSYEIKVENTEKNNNKNNNLTPIKLYLHDKKEEQGEKSEIYVLSEEGIIKSLSSTSSLTVIKRRIISSNNLSLNFNDEKLEKRSSKKLQKNSELKSDITLFLPKYRINNTESPSLFFNKGDCIALVGFWNGDILIENISVINKKDKNYYPETRIYSTREYSPITHIVIDENEIFAICGNALGSVFIYVIDEKDKTIWNLYKVIYDNFSPITSIDINKALNIFIVCDKDGYCMVYTLPKCKLINSFKLKNILYQNNSINNEGLSLFANISIISSSPLPCIIFYFKSKSSLAVLSINGHLIKEKEINLNINTNSIKIFSDRQFIDYLIIFNPKSESIDLYNIIDLQMIKTWAINNYKFIDFIFSKKLDIIYILVKSNEEQENGKGNNNNKQKYNILVLKDANNLKTTFELDENKNPLI